MSFTDCKLQIVVLYVWQMATKYRQYNHQDLCKAVGLVKDGCSMYKAAKECHVPWSTLKDFITRTKDEEDVRQCVPKLGKPFALPVELEQRIYKYIITMQELGFGLTVIQIRKLAYQLAESTGKKHPFNSTEEVAGEWWWKDFKNRYGLTLRVPENIAAYRSSMANRSVINDFYKTLNDLLTKLQIKDCSDRIWNCDETGLSYVVKSSKVVTAIGKKYVYKRTYADRGENHTMLACVNASGHWIPPMIIFKGVRANNDLLKDAIPGSLIKLSPKGWINSELFLEWFQHFVSSIPPSRPVVLLMDSHASHISEGVISLAKENEIFLFTFPPHTTHILQPLDVGVYRPLKQAWGKCLSNHMKENPAHKPNRTDFNKLLKPAYFSAFSPETIISSFKKTGICPYMPESISEEAISTSKLTDRTEEGPANEEVDIESLLALPTAVSERKTNGRRKRDRPTRAKCLNPPTEPTAAKEPIGK